MRDSGLINMDMKDATEILHLFSNQIDIGPVDCVKMVDYGTFPVNGMLKSNEYCFYRVNKISYDDEFPKREAFENVLLSMDNEAFNFVYILTGSSTGIELCLGVVKNSNPNKVLLGTKMSAVGYGENIAEAFRGNFNGSELEALKGEKLKNLIIDSVAQYKHAGLLTGVPSIDEKNGTDDQDFQGIDRLINSMLGEEWRIAIVCEPVGRDEVAVIKDNIYELYNRLSMWAKQNIQQTVNEGTSISKGENSSDTRGKNESVNNSDSYTKGKSSDRHDENSSKGSNSSSTKQSGITKGINSSHTFGTSNSYSKNQGSSKAITVEWANKCVQETMKYIDEEMLERIKTAFSKKMFKTSVYYMAKEAVVLNRLKVGLMSLFQGNNPSYSPLTATRIDLSDGINFQMLSTYQNNYAYAQEALFDKLILLGRPNNGTRVGLNTYLVPREVSLLAGLPQKEVPGLVLKQAVDFGLNIRDLDADNDDIYLGSMVQRGRSLKSIPFYLRKKSISKHIFIAGVTGSGKTTTCHRVLAEADIPFMVIEPAKTEYRTLIKNKAFGKNLIVFTVGNEQLAPFRINPFELVPGELITGHIDMLKATFTSAFPMEASMPQLLEEAMYSCYEALGWDIETNSNVYCDDPFTDKADWFPQLSDLLKAMEKVVEDKGFDDRLKNDYIGSLKSRLSNLTVGSKGMMLNCAKSVNFNYLATHNVILELEDIKSPEEKALIMGFILSRMSAVIKSIHKRNECYSHITLIEEAHRLLSKFEYGDSGAKKVAVETFTDLLAEVRKYGEGLIIVDQIPNKLAPEVLKNTNTKIIHRILARDDKEVVGDTMLMNDKQKEYLSSLDPGQIIIYSDNTDNPVNVQVKRISDTNEPEVDEAIVAERFEMLRHNLGICYDQVNISPFIKQFSQLADCFRGKDSEILTKWEKIQMLWLAIKNRVAQNNLDIAEILPMLIHRREILTGNRYKYTFESPMIYEKRKKVLKEFYLQLDAAAAEDLCEYRRRQGIMKLLMSGNHGNF